MLAADSYYYQSRAPRYSILFAAPLLLIYEVLAWATRNPTGPSVRNGADVMLKSLFVRIGGDNGLIAFEVLLAAVGIALVTRDWRQHRGALRGSVFLMMLCEAIALALLTGVALRYVTGALLHFFRLSQPESLDQSTQLILSLGAGIYEELLFRVILVSALTWIATRALGWSPRVGAVVAVVLSALIFSAFHYIGAYGDTLTLASFLFRFLAGLVFSTLYVLRGFGVTAWTHALYDVFVTVA